MELTEYKRDILSAICNGGRAEDGFAYFEQVYEALGWYDDEDWLDPDSEEYCEREENFFEAVDELLEDGYVENTEECGDDRYYRLTEKGRRECYGTD